jgi:hypothetical protein
MSEGENHNDFLVGVARGAAWAQYVTGMDPFEEIKALGEAPTAEALAKVLQDNKDGGHSKDFHNIESDAQAQGFSRGALIARNDYNYDDGRDAGWYWAKEATPDEREKIATLDAGLTFEALSAAMGGFGEKYPDWARDGFCVIWDSGARGFVQGVRDYIEYDKGGRPIHLTHEGGSVIIKLEMDENLELLPTALKVFEDASNRKLTDDERERFAAEMREAMAEKSREATNEQPIAAE